MFGKKKNKISLIVAMSDNNVIGINNSLPWHLPNDLKFFKASTMGKPIIMGRKTFESIGRPLPGRQNIVVTRDKTYSADGVTICYSIEDAIEQAKTDEPVIIGGGTIYQHALKNNLVEQMYITRVHTELEGDAFFPEFSIDEWRCVEEDSHQADDKHEYDYTFMCFERV